MTERLNKAGRPRGGPSQVLPVRGPVALIERLDRSLDLAETRTGLRGNRTEAIQQALASWLDAKEEALGVPWSHPSRTPKSAKSLLEGRLEVIVADNRAGGEDQRSPSTGNV